MSAKAKFQHERRQAPRTAIDRPARLRLNEWSRLLVEVTNISRDGFSATADALPRAGAYVTLEVPGIGRVEARVVWCEERRFGARFIRPLDLRLCGWLAHEPLALPAEAEIKEVAALLASRAAAVADEAKAGEAG
jgi:hypothetical protein